MDTSEFLLLLLDFSILMIPKSYMGKSTGHGALAIWTHYLTETEWMSSFSSSSSSYRGPAVKAQAGVSVLQIYEEASAHGYSVIGGACPSVGYTGGFIQGGGHGPLSSIYGMAADDVLSFEVVTTNGDFVTASATQNPDLFWALRGGVRSSVPFSIDHPDSRTDYRDRGPTVSYGL